MLEIEQLNSMQAKAIKAKLLGILADCVENGASVGFMLPLDYAEMQSYWEEMFADIGDYRVFLIAKWDGEIAGTAQLELAAKKNGRHRAEIQKLLVHSRYRGKGIAKALMEKLEEIAKANGRTLLILDTQSGSVAESLYRKLGWLEAGQIPHFAATPHGKLEPTTFFYKELPSLP